MQALLHFFFVLLALLLLVEASEVAGECEMELPECEKCEVLVEQEKTDLVLVDWSQAWWDLQLPCLNSLSVSLNGESQFTVRARKMSFFILQTPLIYSLGLSSK